MVCICGAFIHCSQYLEILPATKLIKPASLGKPAPQTESWLATPKSSEGPTEADSCVQFQNVGIKFKNNTHTVLCSIYIEAIVKNEIFEICVDGYSLLLLNMY